MQYKYLKAEQRFNTKESFQWFYVPVTFFGSLYGKDGNYYPKVFLEKSIYNFIWRKIKMFGFWGIGISWNIRNSVSWNMKHFAGVSVSEIQEKLSFKII